MVDDQTLPSIRNVTTRDAKMVGGADMANFGAAHTSYTWSINNAMAKCDWITLDSGLN